MVKKTGTVSSLLLALAIAVPLATTGCAEHHYYRAYDPAHNDYHNWDNAEAGFYVQWETETHRDHRDFRKRNNEEQQEYWKWRHDHSDHDHDRH